MDSTRLLATPVVEISLALGSAPRAQTWIDPQLSAVYIIGNDANDLLKIGYADNLKHRFSGMDCGSPVALRLLHFIYFVGRLVSKSVEGQVHDLLSDHRRKGEWFEVTLSEAAAAIAAVANERHLAWWTEGERRRLGTIAIDHDNARKWHGKNFFLRH
jgi:hypothetical protein